MAGFLLPASPNEEGSSGYTVTWKVPEDVSDRATISLFYRSSVTYTGTIGVDVPIVQNLPYKAGSYAWNTSGLPSAAYQIKAVVDDGINNLPVDKISRPDDACLALSNGVPYGRAFAHDRFPGTLVFFSAGSVRVTDTTPPATPTGLQVVSAGGGLLLRWDAAPATADVTRYLMRWGLANGSGFTPEAQRVVSRGQETSLRVGAVKPGQPYGVDILALDASGNASAPSAPVLATPEVCTVAGNTVTPLTGSQCSLIATQAGDGTYYAAPSVVRAVVITGTALDMPVRVYAPVIAKQ